MAHNCRTRILPDMGLVGKYQQYLFPSKIISKKKLFKFSKKKTILGPFWVHSAQVWAKMNFPGKKGSVSFKIFELSKVLKVLM